MSEVVEEYSQHHCQIVKEEDDQGARYHYDGPMGRLKSFDSPDKARLYADVSTVIGGFRETTDERGAPPLVAQAREDALMAYYAAQPTLSVRWVSTFFDLPEERVREYIASLQNRAEQKRAENCS
jgi:hypothetical protein